MGNCKNCKNVIQKDAMEQFHYQYSLFVSTQEGNCVLVRGNIEGYVCEITIVL